jgi:hypothetical protein
MNTGHLDGSTSLAPSIKGEMRCNAVTKSGGSCHNRPVAGSKVCVMHSEGHTGFAKQGADASAKARGTRVTKRQEAQELAKLTTTERLRLNAAERTQELLDSIWYAATVKHDVQAQRMVLERLDGKVIDTVRFTGDKDDPEGMNDQQLKSWLAAQMEPEEAARFLDETERLEQQFKQD